jgi:hypothetical protein
MDRVLSADMLDTLALCLEDTVEAYMQWYFKISHLYIILIPEGYSVRLVQFDVVVQEETSSQSTSKLLGRLASIRDILHGLMASYQTTPVCTKNLRRLRR